MIIIVWICYVHLKRQLLHQWCWRRKWRRKYRKYKCIKLVSVTFDIIVQWNCTILQIKLQTFLQTNMYLIIQCHHVLMKIHQYPFTSNNATKYNVQISISKIKQQNDFFEILTVWQIQFWFNLHVNTVNSIMLHLQL